MIKTNLFVPITRAKDCILNKIPVKRGVLLGGVYGTGKTMAAAVASKLAVEAGITYVYVPRADELRNALEFAKQYQSPACVVFCEDIDRALAGERSVQMDDILNTLDGIDAKTGNVIVVLTTNAMEQINPAMLRPGRLDAVIEVPPPDGEAVTRLLRSYGKGVISEKEDLTAVGEVLSGHIPAVIAEVVKRAKLYQIGLQAQGSKVAVISAEALLASANTMAAQVRLLKGKTPDPEPDTLTAAFRGVVREVVDGPGTQRLSKMASQLQEVHNHTTN
jgi:transitional endoplasmic reticulum ATPase